LQISAFFAEKPNDFRPLAVLVVVGRQAAIAGPGECNRQQDDDQESRHNVSLWIKGSGLHRASARREAACIGTNDIKEGFQLPLVRCGQKFAFWRQIRLS